MALLSQILVNSEVCKYIVFKPNWNIGQLLNLNTFSRTFKSKKAVLVYLFLLLGVSFATVLTTTEAAFNEQINYQGKLTDNLGSPVADGTYNVRFFLYTVPTGGSNIWTETASTTVTSGLFSHMLGTSTSLSGIDFNQTLYLGVEVGGTGAPSWDGEMTPRKILGAVPAAFEAQQLDGIGTSSFLRSDQADTIAATEASTLLTINQSGTGDILNLLDGGTEVFTVTDGGNVGIGTSSPQYLLDLYTPNGSPAARIVSGSTSGGNALLIESIDTAKGEFRADFDSAGHPTMTINSSAGAIAHFETEYQNTRSLIVGHTFANGQQLTATTSLQLGIDANDTGNGAFEIAKGSWNGRTGSDGTSLLYITNDGNVGIGDRSPSALLNVGLGDRSSVDGTDDLYVTDDIELDGDLYLAGALYDTGGSAGTNGFILQSTGSGIDWVATSTLGLTGSSIADDSLDWAQFTDTMTLDATTTIAMAHALNFDSGTLFIDGQNDRVGVGTSSPRAQLEVTGDLIVASSTNLNIYNPEFGFGVNNILAGGAGFHTILNGRLMGADGGTGQVIIGGTVSADTTGSNFNTVVGVGARASGTVADSSVFGRNAQIINASRSTALGYGAYINGLHNTLALGTTTTAVWVPGSIGIGTTSSSSLLSLQATSSSADGITIINTAAQQNSHALLRLETLTAGDPKLQFIGNDETWSAGIDVSDGTGTFKFVNASGLGSPNQAILSLSTTSNVGVGTSTPDYTLTVDGDTMLAGALYDNNYDAGTNGFILQSTGAGIDWVATSTLGLTGSSIADDSLDWAQFSDTMTLDATTTIAMAHALNFDSGTLYIDGQNNVIGIGTTTPDTSSLLHLADVGNSRLRIQSEGGADKATLSLINTIQDWQLSVEPTTGDFLLNSQASGGDNEFYIQRTTGNVGIGTTSPASLLDVYGDFRAGTSSTPTLFVDASTDRVGIGDSTPEAPLDIAGTDNEVALIVQTEDGGRAADIFSLATDLGGVLRLYNGSGAANVYLSGANGYDSYFTGGRIGIGTTTPSTTLHVYTSSGGATARIQSAADSGTDSNGAFLDIVRLNSGPDAMLRFVNAVGGDDVQFQLGLDGNGQNDFYIQNGAGTSYLTIADASGNVGLATTTPDYTLTVDGDTMLAGALYDNNYDAGTNGFILQSTGAGIDWVATSTLGLTGSSIADDSLDWAQFSDTMTLDATTTIAMAHALNFDSGTLYIDGQNDWVGIGTTTPATLLHLAATGAADGDALFRINEDGNSIFRINARDGAGLRVGSSRYFTINHDGANKISIGNLTGTPDIVVADGEHLLIRSREDDGGAPFGVAILNDVAMPAGVPLLKVGIGTSDASTEYFRIADTGNVGIGTTSPASLLDVYGDLRVGTSGTPTLFANTSANVVTIGTTTNLGATLSVAGSGLFGTGANAGKYATARALNLIDDEAVMQVWRTVASTSPNHPAIEFIHGSNDSRASVANTWWDIYAGNTDSGELMSFRRRTGGTGIDYLTLQANGNVGIGTTTPDRPLHVFRSGGNADLKVTEYQDNAFGVMWLSEKARGTIASPSAVQANDELGKFYFYGHDGNSFELGGGLKMEVDGTVADGSLPTRIVFETNDGSGETERMRLDQDGNLGIGTTTPSYLLTVDGSAMFAGALYDNNYSVGTNGFILQSTGSGINWVATSTLGLGAGSGTVNTGTLGQIAFYESTGTAVTGTSSIFIDSSGNVGIGTSTPSARLYVAGGDIELDTNSEIRVSGNDSALIFSNGTGRVLRLLNYNPTGWADSSTPNSFFQLGQDQGFFSGNNGVVMNRFGISSEGTTISNQHYSGLSAPTAVLHVETDTTTQDIFNLQGVTSQSADYINITSAGGVEGNIFTVNASGSVGISTTSPATKLHVDHETGSTTNEIAFFEGGFTPGDNSTILVGPELTDGHASELGFLYQNASGERYGYLGIRGSTPALTWDVSGNAGVGTTSPSQEFAVDGDMVITGALYDNNYDPGTNGFILQSTGSGIDWVATSTLGLGAGSIADDSLDWAQFTDTMTLDATTTIAMVHALNFDSGTFFIDGQNDRVGIGTSTPGLLLELVSAADAQLRVSGRNTVGVATTDPNSGSIIIGGGVSPTIAAGIGYDATSRDLYIENLDNSGSDRDIVLRSNGSELLRLKGEGNVGIGTTSPASLLDVYGDFRVGTTSLPTLFVDTSTDRVMVGNTDGTNLFNVQGTNSGEGIDLRYSSGFTSFNVGSASTDHFRIGLSGTPGAFVTGTQGNDPVLQALNSSDLYLNAGNATMVFDSASNNIGIATTSPASTLDVWGDFRVGTSGTSTLFVDTSTNRVGVGTTNPSALFEAAGRILSSPSTPVKVGGTSTDAAASDIFVRGDYAYLTSESTGDDLEIFNISDPTNPVEVGSVEAGNGATAVQVVGDYAYVTSGSVEDFKIFDISNPTNPVKVSGVGTDDSADDVKISGHYAYVVSSDVNDDLEVFDISDPTNPVKVGGVSTADNVNDIIVRGNYAYLGLDFQAGDEIEIFDISDPTNMVKVGGAAGPQNIRGMALSGQYLYTVGSSATNEFRIFDVSDPTNPTEVGAAETGGTAYEVTIAGDYAYVAGSTGFRVFDVSSSTNPTQIALVALDDVGRSIAVSGNYAYVTSNTTGDDIEIFDLGGIQSPTGEIGSLLAHRIDTGELLAETANFSTGLNVGQNAQINGVLSITGTASTSLLTSNTNPALIVQSGYVGVGTSSPTALLTIGSSTPDALPAGALYNSAFIAGSLELDGAFYDASNSAGTAGYVLQSTGTSTEWVATSSLGIGGGSSVSFGSDNQIPFTNAGGTDFDYVSAFVFDGDNLGIGTPSPSNTLHVSDNSSAIARFESTITSASFNGAGITLISNDSALLADGDRIGHITFTGSTGVSTEDNSAQIAAYADGAWGSVSDTPSRLVFETTPDGSTTRAEAMRITGDGNVGIGTTSPASKLDVWGDFQVGTSGTPTLFVDVSTDRVGIGTTAPAYDLDITGQVHASQGLVLSSAQDIDITNSGHSIYFSRGGTNYVTIDTLGDDFTFGSTAPNASSGHFVFGAPSASMRVIQDDGNTELATFYLGQKVLLYADPVGTWDRTNFGIALDKANDSGYASTTDTVFYIDNYTGNVGIGTTSPTTLLTVGSSTPGAIPAGEQYNSAFIAGSLELDGALYDGSDSAGTSGMVLQTTGSGVTWVATSSLNISSTPPDPLTATFVVAATSSANTAIADYTADGTDDQDTIQSAIDALPAEGGIIYLLEGFFAIADEININDKNITLVGAGQGRTVFRIPTSTNSTFDVIEVQSGGDNFVLRDITIDGNKAGNTTGTTHGIQYTGAGATSTIYNVTIKDSPDEAIRISSDYDNITIDSSRFIDNGDADSAIMAIGSSMDNLKVVNNYISGSTNGININSSNNFNFQIIGNAFVEHGTRGIVTGTATEVVIANNTFKSSVASGAHVYIGSNSSRVTVSGNTIEDGDDDGIAVFGDYVNVTNNTLSDIGNATSDLAIAINGADVVSVAGNVIASTSGQGIENLGGDNVTITGNSVANTGHFGIESSGSGVVINGNILSNTALTAIYVTGNRTSVTGNTVNEVGASQDGISVNGGDDNVVTGNNVYDASGSDDGIYIGSNALRNHVADNYVSGAGWDSEYRDIGDGTTYLQQNRGMITANDTDFDGNAYTAFSITQLGTGNILDLIDADGSSTSTVFTVLDGGNVGVGTTTPNYDLSVAGDIGLTGALYDNTYSAGTNGYVLQSTGSGVTWVATSTLGLGGGSSVSFGSDNQIPYTNSGGTDFDYSSGFTFDGLELAVDGSINIADTTLGYELGGDRILYASSTNFSVIGGIGAGAALLSDGTQNTAFGHQALATATSSDENSAFGFQSLFSNTTGQSNTGIGYYALRSNTTGSENTALGHLSLAFNTTGINNVGLGSSALQDNTTGNGNIAIGYRSLYENLSGSSNVAIGSSALIDNVTGELNVAVGASALANTLVDGNTAVGYAALFSNASGTQNVAIGRDAGYSNIAATSTTAIGYESARGTLSFGAGEITSVGAQALRNITTGAEDNTAFGYRAGYNVTSGANNVLLGYQAGDNITTGANNILLGYDIDAPLAAGSNQLSIGNLIYGTGIDGTGTTISSGNIGIATSSPASTLDVWGDFRVGTSSTPLLMADVSSGYFGIGTSSPASALHVANGLTMLKGESTFNDLDYSGDFTHQLYIGNSSDDNTVTDNQGILLGTGGFGNNPMIRMRASGGSLGYLGWNNSETDFHINVVNNSRPFHIKTDGTERLTVLSSGNVGIGTTSPTTLLTVGSSTPGAIPAGEQYNSAFIAGSLELDGALYDGSDSAGTSGMVLQTTGSGVTWVATSSLGIGGTDTNSDTATYIVAATSSTNASDADYIADGTNDEATIQAAIDALPAEGGIVHLLEGFYGIEGQIDIDREGVVLQGSGPGTVLRVATGTNGTFDVIDHLTGAGNTVIRDLTIDGNKAGQTSGTNHGIRYTADGATSTIHNVSIKNMRDHAIYVDDTYYHILIDGVTVTGDGSSADYAVLIDGNNWRDITITNSVFDNVGSAVLENSSGGARLIVADNHFSRLTRSGVELTSSASDIIIADNIFDPQGLNSSTVISAGTNIDQVTITNNIIKESANTAISLTSSNSSVIGNTIEVVDHSSADAVRVSTAGQHILIADNHIGSTTGSGAGIEIDGDYVTFTGNIVDTPGGEGIDIDGDYIVVSNNVVESPGESGITAGGSAEIAITSNIVRNASIRGIYLSSIDNFVVNDNTVIGSGNHGIEVATGLSGTVNDNRIDEVGASDNGINVSGAEDIVISGNAIYDASGSAEGIQISSSALRIHLDGNIITGAGWTNEIDDNSSGTTYLTNNRIDILAGANDFQDGAYTAFSVTQTGTGNLLDLVDANGVSTTTVFTVLDGGNVGIGDASPDASLSVAGAPTGAYNTLSLALANSTATGGNQFSNYAGMTAAPTGASTARYVGSYSISYSNTGNTSGATIVGQQTEAQLGSSGDASSIIAAQFDITGLSGSSAANAYSVLIPSYTAAAGAITSGVGLAIEAINSATNNTHLLLGTSVIPAGNFALYSAATTSSYFAGNVGIGTTSPNALLTVGSSTSNALTSGEQYNSAFISGSLELDGALYDSSNSAGTNGMVLQTNGASTQWVSTSSLNITGASSPTAATFVVAATSSQQGANADYVADGTNDEATIQAAIDALPATGGVVYLLEGFYGIEGQIDIDKEGVTLQGSGPGTVLRVATNTDSTFDVIDHLAGSGSSVIRDLTIDGNKAGQSSGTMYGIRYSVDGATSTIHNVTIKNMRDDGIYVDASYDNVTIDSVTISNNNDNGDYGIYVDGSNVTGLTISNSHFSHVDDGINTNTTNGEQIKIVNNHFYEPATNGVNISRGQYVLVANNTFDGNDVNNGSMISVGSNASDVAVLNNVVNGSNRDSIGIGAVRVTVSGNTIHNTGNGTLADAIDVSSSASYVVVSDNLISTTTAADGINADGDYMTITGNIIENTDVNGIGVNGGENIVIANNTIKNTGIRGIYLAFVDNFTINDNMLIDIGANGIELDDGVSGTINGNTIDEVGPGDAGIDIDEANDIVVSGNAISDAGGSVEGIEISNDSYRIHLDGNVITGTWTYLIDDNSSATTYLQNNRGNITADPADFDGGAYTAFSITQLGTGNILDLIDADGSSTSTVFTVLDGGNVGVGTTTPNYDLSVAGDIGLTGALYDNNYSAGTNGYVLQSTGSGVTWIATSSLGIGGGGSSLLTDAGTTTYLTSTTDRLAIGTTSAQALLTTSAAGLSQTWSQVGNDLSLSPITGPSIAALSPNRVAVIDESDDTLKTYEFDGTNWSQVGTGPVLGSPSYPVITALSPNRVAFFDVSGDVLQVYEFDGNSWSQVGNDLTITVASPSILAALTSNRIAFFDNQQEEMRVYEFDGTNWSQIGSDSSILSGFYVGMSALGPNRVAWINNTDDELRTYEFNGDTWSQVGNSLAISGGASYPVLTTLSPNRVAYIDGDSDELTVYEFDGTSWSQVGTALTTQGSATTRGLAALTPNRVAYINNGEDDLRTYQFSAPLLAAVDSNDMPLFSVSDSGVLTFGGSVATTTAGAINFGSQRWLTITNNYETNADNTSSLQAAFHNESIFLDRVGIGTTSPGAELTVAGSIDIDSSTGTLSFLGSDVLIASTSLETLSIGPNAFINPTSTAVRSNFIGWNAGRDATRAASSTFIGPRAGQGAVDAISANFIGSNAGYGAINAAESIFLGSFAGYEATGAATSTFIGMSAGQDATNAYYSTFIGSLAGNSATNAHEALFIGSSAGLGATNAASSTFIGPLAGNFADNASRSIFIGEGAGDLATDAANSIFIGREAGSLDSVDNTSGGTSIAIGNFSGTGGFSNSIAFGRGVINSAAQQFNIGNVLYGTSIYNSDTQSATPVSAGSVGVGTSSPASKLDVWGDFQVGTSGTPTLFVDASTGWVGIGTSTPSTTLHVDGLFHISGSGTSTIEDNLLVQGTLKVGTSSVVITEDGIQATNNFTVETNNFGVGTTTPGYQLTVDGTAMFAGAVYDSNYSAGTNGYVMQTTGSGVQWVATSSLGLSGATNVNGLSDALSNATENQFFIGHDGGSIGAIDDRNTAVGITALDALNNSGGLDNTAVGFDALTLNTSGDYNTAIGSYALNEANSERNVAVGYQAGFNTATGTANDHLTLIGYQAGYSNDGDRLTAVGTLAGYENTGDIATALGWSAGYQNTGDFVVGIGQYAGRQNEGDYQVAIGYQAGRENTGLHNIAIGNDASYQNTSDYSNAIGYQAFRYRNALNSVALGSRAGFGSDATRRSIENSTFIGHQAGYAITTGNNNLLLGYQTGNALTSGSNNIAIGYDIDLPSNTASNQLTIGNIIYGTGIDATNATEDSNALIGIGTNAPASRLHIAGSQGDHTAVRIQDEGTGGETWLLAATNDSNPFGGGNFGLFDVTENDYRWLMTDGQLDLNSVSSESYIGLELDNNNTGGRSYILASTDNSNSLIGGGKWGVFDNDDSAYRLVVDSVGDVGIGTTSPASKLDVWGDFRAGTSGIPALFVDASTDRVGIGTSTPSHQFHVHSNSDETLARFTSAGAGAYIEIYRDDITNGGSSRNAGISFGTLNEADFWTLGIDPEYSGDEDFFITNQGVGGVSFLIDATTDNVGIGTGTSTPASKLQIQGSGTTNPFSVSSSSGDNLLTIDTDGNVGIGTTSPAAKLDIFADPNAYTEPLLHIQRAGAFSAENDYLATMQTYGNRSGSNGTQHGLYVQAGFNSSDTEIARFSAIGSGFIDTPRMVVMSSGDIGIGTTTPARRLHVSDDANEKARFQDDDQSGNSAITYLSFFDSAETRIGYIGDASSGNQDIYISSDNEDIAIQGTGGTCTLTGGASGGSCFSDENLKIVQGDISGTLEALSALDLKTFYWNEEANEVNNASTTILNTGFLAQDVATAFPELVVTDESGYKTLDYATLNMYGLVATKELNAKVDNLASSTASTTEIFIGESGNIGLGTTSPAYKLSVDGDINVTGSYLTDGADYAEYFYTNDTDLQPGEVVCLDITQENAVERCTNASDTNVMGIISTKPAFLGNATFEKQFDPHQVMVAMLGQIPANVSDENGEVRAGDSLTSASTAGYVMKANPGDSTVAVALENLDTDEGEIQVLISRRNKSLTVEEVEQEVTERIATMEIEDEVQIMLTDAIAALDLDEDILAIVEEELQSLDISTEVNSTLTIVLRNLGLIDSDTIISSTTASSTPEETPSWMNTIVDLVVDRITALLQSAGNGLSSLFADQVTTNELCVGEVCIDEATFLQMVEQTASSTVAAPVVSVEPEPESEPEPVTDVEAETTPESETLTEPNPETVDEEPNPTEGEGGTENEILTEDVSESDNESEAIPEPEIEPEPAPDPEPESETESESEPEPVTTQPETSEEPA